MFARFLVGLLCVPLAGCGLLAQSLVGWSDEESRRSQRTHEVVVRSLPSGLPVHRRDATGNEVALGTTPFNDAVQYEVEEVVEVPNSTALWVATGLEMALGIAALVAGVASADTDLEDQNSGPAIGWLVTGSLLWVGGSVDMLAGIIQFMREPVVVRRNPVDPPSYVYVARPENGPAVSQVVMVPDQAVANLMVEGSLLEPKITGAPPPPPPVAPLAVITTDSEAKKWVLAVMEVEDANVDDPNLALNLGLIRNVGDQLRIFIAQQGVRTIDRGSQQKALETQIGQMKQESYQACYDDACQIELGKALAATHILRSKITRFGTTCVLNVELIDLRSEVTTKAASARGACEAEGFLSMAETVADNVLR